MTSGNFTSFSVSSIFVNRDERQRQDLGDIPGLAESIKRVGLIHPIVITRDGLLIAGERRYTAVKSLGHSHIAVQFVDELDPLELQAIELEENVKRKDISWQEECSALRRYHNLRSTQANGDWSTTKTAEALGLKPTTVQEKLGIADAIAAGDERVINAPKMSTAGTIVVKTRNRQKQSNFEKLTIQGEALSLATPAPKRQIPILNVPFDAQWLTRYSGPKINFIHCDFPYGVNAGKHNQGAGSTFGGYEDSPDVYWNLIDTLGDLTVRHVAADAHLMFWFSMDYYTETKAKLEAYGWNVSPFPLIWHKSDNKGIMPDAKRQPRRIYETAFHCSLGERFIVDAVSNVCSSANNKEIHMSEKPIDMLRQFFRMYVDDTTVMFDPTCGSANAVALAESMGAAKVLGCEMNKEFYEAAVAKHWGEKK